MNGDTMLVKTRRLVLPTRLAVWEAHFRFAGAEWGVEPLLLAAVCDRESAGGATLSPPNAGGTGDLGHGRGLMQIDDRSWASWLKGAEWRDALTNIRKGAEILATELDRFASFPDGRRAGIASYNCGASNVRKAVAAGKDVDAFTSGGNYSADVLRRLALVEALQGAIR